MTAVEAFASAVAAVGRSVGGFRDVVVLIAGSVREVFAVGSKVARTIEEALPADYASTETDRLVEMTRWGSIDY